jgi:uncharacterized DUF497 family protein
MNHSDFDWDFENITHLARHGATPEEAESVFDRYVLDLGFDDSSGEPRYIEAGCTVAGRVLQIVTTERGRRTRFVTAYDADRNVVARYFRESGGL